MSMPTPRPQSPAQRLGPTGRTLILCGLGLLLGLTMTVTVALGLRGADNTSLEPASRAVPAEMALQAASSVSSRAQRSFHAAAET